MERDPQTGAATTPHYDHQAVVTLGMIDAEARERVNGVEASAQAHRTRITRLESRVEELENRGRLTIERDVSDDLEQRIETLERKIPQAFANADAGIEMASRQMQIAFDRIAALEVEHAGAPTLYERLRNIEVEIGKINGRIARHDDKFATQIVPDLSGHVEGAYGAQPTAAFKPGDHVRADDGTLGVVGETAEPGPDGGDYVWVSWEPVRTWVGSLWPANDAPAAATENLIIPALAEKNLDLCAALGRILAVTPDNSDWDPTKAAAMMQAIAKEALGQ